MFLNSQKNALHKAVLDQELNKRDFSLTESAESKELKLIHKQTGFHFRVVIGQVVINSSGGRAPRLYTFSTPKLYQAAVDPQSETQHVEIKEWTAVIGIFTNWLVWLKAEIEQPDLWAEMEDTPHMFADEVNVGNDKFTLKEIKQLQERVAEVEQLVIGLGLPQEAEEAITETIREVPAKAKRLTKKEVVDVFAGALVKEGLKWTLTTENMAAIWHAFQHFFTVLLP